MKRLTDSGQPSLGSLVELRAVYEECRDSQKIIGLCHGCFDVTHWGHVLHFQAAKHEVDILVVSISSASIVKSTKGNDRPYYSDRQRLIMLNSIEAIDHTYICDMPTSEEVIRELNPNKYFKGGDYSENTSHLGFKAEVEMCTAVGCELRVLKEVESYSTSSLIEQIRSFKSV